MKHLKYLLMAALVAMPLTACDEDELVIEPTPVGTITGSVTAEGTGLAGVSVTLVGATSQSATTGANGAYTFTNVEAGSYGVTIDASTHPEVSFAVTSRTTSITTQGQTATVDFSGSYVRTASITGVVSASGHPLAGVSVTVTGGPDNVSVSSVTNAGGEFSATGLRAGTFTVTISNIPTGVTFTTTTQSVTVATGESKTAHFPGEAVQLATISGAVTVDDVGRAGVPVALSGGATAATETGPGGVFSFTNLTPGAYTVTITPPANTEFEVVSRDLTVEAGETGVVNFAGKGPTVPATISIQSVTKGGTTQPVDLNNVFGQIDVTLNLRANDEDVTRVDVLVDDHVAASQVFTAAELAQMAEEDPEVAGDVQVITLSFNTARYDVDADTYTATARYENGDRVIGAQVHVEEREDPRDAANVIEVFFNNANTFHVLADREGILTALDPDGRRWYGGPDFEITVFPIPVMYNGQTVVSMTSGLRNEAGDALGNCGVQTEDEAPFGFTWTCVGREATGFLPVVTSTVTDAGEDGPITGFGDDLNIANVAITADHPFPMRIDVRAPQGGAIIIVTQDGLLNMGNWVNDEYSFAQSGAYTPATDGGVRGVTRETLIRDLEATGVVVAPEDLEESVTNKRYRLRVRVQDALGNARNIDQSANEPNHPLTTFGYDVTPPSFVVAEGDDALGQIEGPYNIINQFTDADGIYIRATDNLAGFSQATAAEHALISIRGLFNGEGATEKAAIVAGTPANIAAAPFEAARNQDPIATLAAVGTDFLNYIDQTAFELRIPQLRAVIEDEAARYYLYQLRMRDQAGNIGKAYRAVYLNNNSVPVVQNLSNPATFDAATTFTASLARDSVELLEGSLELRYPNTLGTIVWERPTADIVSVLRMDAWLPDGELFSDVIYRPVNNVSFPLGFDALGLPFLKSVQAMDPASVATSKPDSVRVRVFSGFGADDEDLNHSSVPWTGGSGFSALISNSIVDEEIPDATRIFGELFEDEGGWTFEVVRGDDPAVEDCNAQYCVRAIGPLSVFTNPFRGGPVLIAWADDDGKWNGNDNGNDIFTAGTGYEGELQWRVAVVATPNFNHPFPTRDSGADRIYEWTFSLPAGVPSDEVSLAAIGIDANTGDGLLWADLFEVPEPEFNVVFEEASYEVIRGGDPVTMALEHGFNSTLGGFDVNECVFLDATGQPRAFPPAGMSVAIAGQACAVTATSAAVAGNYTVRATASQGDYTDTAVTTVVVVDPVFGITISPETLEEVIPLADPEAFDFSVSAVPPSGPISALLCAISPTTGVSVAPDGLGTCQVTVTADAVPGSYTITATAQEEGTAAEASATATLTLDYGWWVTITPETTADARAEIDWVEGLRFDIAVGGTLLVNTDVDLGNSTCALDPDTGISGEIVGENGDLFCRIAIEDFEDVAEGDYDVTINLEFLITDQSFSGDAYAFLGERPVFDPEVDIETSPENRREIERDRTANFVVVSGFGLGIDIDASAAVVSPSDGGVTAEVVEDTDGTFVVQVDVEADADTGNYTVTVTYIEEVTGDEVEKEIYIRIVDVGTDDPGVGE